MTILLGGGKDALKDENVILWMCCGVGGASLFLSACKEDVNPELENELKQQRETIGQLEDELSELKNKTGDDPGDFSEALATAKQKLATNEEAVKALQAEIDAAEQKQQKLADEFSAYRRNYPIND